MFENVDTQTDTKTPARLVYYNFKTGINLGGAMGKNAPYFSKRPLHLESMGPFNNVNRWAVMFLYESLTRNGPCYSLANNIPV